MTTVVTPANVARRGGRVRAPAAYLLLLPSTLFLGVFFLWPMVQGLLLSLQTPEGAVTGQYFSRMVNARQFWPAVRNTLLLTVVILPLQFALALAMGLILQAKPRFRGFFLYFWAVPLAVSDLAAGLVWLSIFTDNGYLNSFIATLGLGDGYSWLNFENYWTMFLAIVLAETWRATALVLVIVVAGLQVVPKDYDEAAQVFQATFWQRLRHVTLPLIKPSLQVALILRTILAFQAFAVVVALTGENFPVLVSETYDWYAALQNPNVAAAFAVVIMAVSMLFALLYLRLLSTGDETRGPRA